METVGLGSGVARNWTGSVVVCCCSGDSDLLFDDKSRQVKMKVKLARKANEVLGKFAVVRNNGPTAVRPKSDALSDF
jgi:hypothetical protein